MRVLIADKLPDAARTHLQAAGIEVVVDASLKGDALSAALAEHDPDVLVVRSTKVQKPQLDAAKGLQLVVRAGAGVNTIDLDYASSRGVYVSNCPGMNAVAVAELTFGHILNADRRISDGVAELRAGHWNKGAYSKNARGLKGRVLGVIGVGSIGQEVIKRALAFEMVVVAWSPSLTQAKADALGIHRALPDAMEVAKRADVLTVHTALTPATTGLIGRAIFEQMRAGTIFVNTTRGPVVDEDALAWAVREKGIRAGLDVFCDEPAAKAGPWTHPLVALPTVYGTHHIGASTDEAQEAVADEALRVILEWQRTGDAPNCVNLSDANDATHMLVVRHEDRVGVLNAIFKLLCERDINVQEMENLIFRGGEAAVARIQLSDALTQADLDALTANDHIFDAKLVTL